ncbi:uncharacterized protein Z518_05569 [Rhinocladiella mackenziei CBS 650.93]|uniref:Rhinocladiella mackenziei CBS 650.93 unplaced genomic scaffold supercont1.4, whole genome shotgun sequence n=1 Tax=Rhinocladiella mackenziei CBS 650.93 TaxID=1442369 RepID=A0A0D2IFW1_9EURO|nr:uncharacterized protein Z518_05569 [Rhinocladiella mackenziei CBS 650.93]KIX04699.1 hypothetical protein Z518_05569 [Rhinocladiella mackenziei CBS 650.93]
MAWKEESFYTYIKKQFGARIQRLKQIHRGINLAVQAAQARDETLEPKHSRTLISKPLLAFTSLDLQHFADAKKEFAHVVAAEEMIVRQATILS